MIQIKLKGQIGRKFHNNPKSVKICTYSRNSVRVLGQEHEGRREGANKMTKQLKDVAPGYTSVSPS